MQGDFASQDGFSGRALCSSRYLQCWAHPQVEAQCSRIPPTYGEIDIKIVASIESDNLD